MRCTIVYFSLSGKTRQAADILATSLRAERIELNTKKPYPKLRFLRLLVGGAQAGRKVTPPLVPYDVKEDQDLYILGTPVWNATMSPALRTFLTENALKGKRVAAFATSLSGDADRCFLQMEELIGEPLKGRVSLRSSKGSFSPRELEKLERFADQLWIDGQEEQ
ncbi:MAG TPA: hypothetical protein GX733_04825 [Tissierellia bacterium]|nr:hypothetical protein [Tissierellia bacterium]